MSTSSIVLVVLLSAALAALLLWTVLSARVERTPTLPGDPRDWREAKHFRRLLKRDPAAARALGERLEAALQAEYDNLHERAATDPAAAAAFAESAADELQGLRALAADFERKTRTDASAEATVAELRLQIERVERDLAWARRLAFPPS